MTFGFDDKAAFNCNLQAYTAELQQLDAVLGPALAARLEDLIDGIDPAEILEELLVTLTSAET
jgi:hypothetical protein